MLTTSDILFGVVMPFILSGLILKLAWMIGRGSQWPGPLAIGVSFCSGFGCIEGAAHLFPPSNAVDWLFYLGLLFMLVGLLDAAVRVPIWLRMMAIFAATLVGAGSLLRFNFTNHTWDATSGSAWLIGIAIVATIWWCCFESTALEAGLAMPLGAMLTTGIAGLVVMLAADQTTGQALGALAIALAATAAVIAWFRKISLERGTSVIVAGVGVCALAAAYFVSDVPIADLLLIAVAPLLLALGRWQPFAKRTPWLHLLIRLVIMLIPLGIAMGLAVAQFKREAAEKSSDPYSMGSHREQPALVAVTSVSTPPWRLSWADADRVSG